MMLRLDRTTMVLRMSSTSGLPIHIFIREALMSCLKKTTSETAGQEGWSQRQVNLIRLSKLYMPPLILLSVLI